MLRIVATLMIVSGLAMAAVPDCGWAQSLPNPGGMAPDTPRMETADPPKDHLNTQDLLFVRQMAVGARAEADLGKLAQKKGRAESVRSFGKRMAEDHTKGNQTLLGLPGVKQASVPKDVDPEHQRMRDELDRTPQADFDVAYLTSQVQDHQKTANLLLWEMSYGQSAALTRYAADALPMVMEHLELAARELRTLQGQQRAALSSHPLPAAAAAHRAPRARQ